LKKGLNHLGILLKSAKMRDHTFLEINWAADYLATNPLFFTSFHTSSSGFSSGEYGGR